MDAMVNKEVYKWDNLIPKAIWRGSDYHFYQSGDPGAKPEASRFIRQIKAAPDKKAAMRALLAGSSIGPRLRAVFMSQLNPDLIDAKFFNWSNKRRTGGSHFGLVTTDHIEENIMGKYKYQLDLGGGGGTTWSGVIPKLSMPGVLFHHETAMKDSYFDQLKPYVHYLPLKEDLSNFEELVRFVETNPTEAQAISQRASDWVREFRKLEAYFATTTMFSLCRWRNPWTRLANSNSRRFLSNKHTPNSRDEIHVWRKDGACMTFGLRFVTAYFYVSRIFLSRRRAFTPF